MNSPGEAKAKAERYKMWAENDGLNDALNAIKQAYLNGFMNSDPSDVQGRENVYVACRVIDRLQSHIINVIGNGKVAEKELARIEKEELKSKFKII